MATKPSASAVTQVLRSQRRSFPAAQAGTGRPEGSSRVRQLYRSDRTDPADRPHDRRGHRRDVRGAAHQLAARARRLQTRTVRILA